MHPNNPELLSWTQQYQQDIEFVDKSFDKASDEFVGLIDKAYEKLPEAFKVKRDKEVIMFGPAANSYKRVEVEIAVCSAEIQAAPNDMQKTLLDMGVKDGDELLTKVMAGRRTVRRHPNYAEKLYSVTLMPTSYREDLIGLKFNYAKQLWLLKPGTSVHDPEHINYWSNTPRVRQVGQVFDLLGMGLVHESYEEGTHASITRYKHKPHPYLAAMHLASANWISELVSSRFANLYT